MKNRSDRSHSSNFRQDKIDKQNEPERLNKFLAECGISSRRKADELIAQGAVKVNGKVVKELGSRVSPGDNVTVNGDPVSKVQNLVYILLNKPKDYITTTHDDLGRKTVFDIVKKKTRLFPVGRLDRNTTGALLLTNDGELANRMTHPRFGVRRIYHATLDRPLEYKHAKQISEGVELEDGKTAPAEVFIFPDEPNKVRLTLIEGKNREIRRIFESLNYMVKKLDRKEYSVLTVKGLNRGEYRHLSRKEVEALKRSVKL